MGDTIFRAPLPMGVEDSSYFSQSPFMSTNTSATKSNKSTDSIPPYVWSANPYATVSFGCHGDELVDCANDIRYVPFGSDEVRRLKAKWIRSGAPADRVGIFAGQISMSRLAKNAGDDTFSALAILASIAGVTIYAPECIHKEHGRWCEFWVSGDADAEKILRLSKKALLCDVGGAWMATTVAGTQILRSYKATSAPLEGVPSWPVNIERKRKPRKGW